MDGILINNYSKTKQCLKKTTQRNIKSLWHLLYCHFICTFWKSYSALTATDGFREVLVFLETFHADEVIAAQNSPVKHGCTFHFEIENTNPLCYKMNLAFKIHISYKQKTEKNHNNNQNYNGTGCRSIWLKLVQTIID